MIWNNRDAGYIIIYDKTKELILSITSCHLVST